jgi:metal transporter CNNM
LGTVLLDSLVHGLLTVIGSTVMIVLMGEIIPQAICSRYGLIIGAHTHIITWISMFVTGPISYPLGFLLNKILGQEVTSSYTRDQVVGMLTRITADIEKPELDTITGKPILTSHEWDQSRKRRILVSGVLALRKKTVKDAMTLLPDIFMLDQDRKADPELLLDIHKHGFSRIPVFANER